MLHTGQTFTARLVRIALEAGEIVGEMAVVSGPEAQINFEVLSYSVQTLLRIATGRVEKLVAYGFESVALLAAASDGKLMEVKGIGITAVAQIKLAISTFNDILTSEEP